VTTIGSVRCFIGQIAGQPYWLVQTGVGPEAATHSAKTVLNRQSMAAAISSGFACSLVPAAVGALIVGTEICSVFQQDGWSMRDDRRPTDDMICTRICDAARQAQIPVKRGSVISAPMVVCGAEDKRRLSQLTGAIALDMESAALGSVAAERGVPFGIVRTVSDLVDEDLPLDFNLFLRPTGWLAGIGALLAHPSGFIGLNRLRKQSRLAAERLAKVFEAYAREGFGRRSVRS
jgi:adenosylhomocysteine nucleosidase